MARASAALQVAGLAVVTIGVAAVSLPAGFIVGGIGLFALGIVIALPARKAR